MNWPIFVLGVLVGALGGITLGVAAVASDQKRLWRTLISRASLHELRQLGELVRGRESSLRDKTSGEFSRAGPPDTR